MAEVIKKTDLINEINANIKKCKEYRKQDPDKLAQQRIDALSKNPCNDGSFYVNIMLNGPITNTYSNAKIIKDKGGTTTQYHLMTFNEYEKTLKSKFKGCIIEVDLTPSKNGKYKVEKIESLDELLKKIAKHDNDSSAKICKFLPKVTLFDGNPFHEDIKRYNKTYNKIYYSIGNFGEGDVIEEYVYKQFIDKLNTEYSRSDGKYVEIKLYEFKSILQDVEISSFSKFDENLEEKFNDFCESEENLDTFTLKNLRKTPGKIIKIYDFVSLYNYHKTALFSSPCFSGGGNIDDTKIESENKFKVSLLKKCGQLIEFSGINQDDEKYITTFKTQFSLFKSLYKKTSFGIFKSDFTKSVENNKNYLNSMLAYEKLNIILSNRHSYFSNYYSNANKLKETMTKLIEKEITFSINFEDIDEDVHDFVKNYVKKFLTSFCYFKQNSYPKIECKGVVFRYKDPFCQKNLKIPVFFDEDGNAYDLNNEIFEIKKGVESSSFGNTIEFFSKEESYTILNVDVFIKQIDINIKTGDVLNLCGSSANSRKGYKLYGKFPNDLNEENRKNEVKKANDNLNKANAEKANAEKKLNDAEQKAGKLDDDDYKKNLKKAQDDLKEHQSKLEKYNAEFEEAKSNLQKAENDFKIKTKEADKASKELSKANFNIFNSEEEDEAIEKTTNEKLKNLEDAEKKLALAQKKLIECENKKLNLQSIVDVDTMNVETLQNEIEESKKAEESIPDLKKEVEKAENNLKKAKTEKTNAENNLNKAKTEKTNAENSNKPMDDSHTDEITSGDLSGKNALINNKFGFNIDNLFKRWACFDIKYEYYESPWDDVKNPQDFYNALITYNEDNNPVFEANTKDLANETLEKIKLTFEDIETSFGDYNNAYNQGYVIADENTQYYKGKLQKIYLDTHPTDDWKDLIDKLETLKDNIGKSSVDENGFIKLKGQNKIEIKSDGKPKNPVKLCDKVAPLDFFGVIGMLGLDDLASKFGLPGIDSSVPSFIYNSNGDICTYKIIKDYFVKKNISTFEELEKDSDYKNKLSIAAQFDKDAYEKFNEEYENIEKNNDITTKNEKLASLFKKKLKIGIADGYYYVPAGLSVDFEYSLKNPVLKLAGSSATEQISLTTLIKDLVNTYKTKKISYKSKVETYVKGKVFNSVDSIENLPLNTKIFLGYPFMPNIQSILGGDVEQEETDVNENEESIYYIPDPDSVKQFIKNFVGGKECTIKFGIYYKRPILCSYPKEKNCDGKCGLQDLFEVPIKQGNPITFNLRKRLDEINKIAIEEEIAKKQKEYQNNIGLIKKTANDVANNLKIATTSENESLNVLYAFGEGFAPLLNLLPLKCITDAANDGKNLICSTSRQARDKTVIEQNESTANYVWEYTKILSDEFSKSVNNTINNVCNELDKTVGNVVGGVGDMASNIIDNITLYDLCQRRMGDFLDEQTSGGAMKIKDGLKNIKLKNISNMFKDTLGGCFVDGVIEELFKTADYLNMNAKNDVERFIKYGDVAALNSLKTSCPEFIENFGNGSGGLDVENIYKKVGFDMNFLTSLQDEIMKRMNPMSMATNAIENFLTPENLVDFAMSAASSFSGADISPGQSIINNLTGAAQSGIEQQTGLNLDSMLSSNGGSSGNSSSGNVENEYQKIETFIYEKNKLIPMLA